MANEVKRARLRRLVAGHFVLAAAPLASTLFPFGVAWLPLLWATFAAPVGSLMVLSIWVGMGGTSFVRRTLLAVAACAYVTLWQVLTTAIQSTGAPGGEAPQWWPQFARLMAPMALIVFLFAAMFGVMRRRWTIVDDAGGLASEQVVRFSVLNMLVITSAVAVVLALMNASRGEGGDVVYTQQLWQMVAVNVLGFGSFFINTACAVHAVLRPGPVARNIALVMLVSVLLGAALSFASRQDLFGWQLAVGGTLISVIPTAIVVGSLLVVRSCGYRLVRRS